MQVPAKVPPDVPDFTLKETDLLLIEDGDQVTLRGILKTSAEAQITIADLMKQVQMLNQIVDIVPELNLTGDNFIAQVEHPLLVEENGPVTLRSLLSAAAQLKETVGDTYDRAQQLEAIGIKVPRWDRSLLAELTIDEKEAAVVSDRNEITLVGFLWLSAQRGVSLAETSARLNQLRPFGITFPTLNLKTLGEHVFTQDDFKAAVSAILYTRNEAHFYDLTEIIRELFQPSPLYRYSVHFDKSRFLCSNIEEFFPMYVSSVTLDFVARLILEPPGQVMARLRKFEVLGLEFTTD
jgi:hypothetical protein